MPEDVVEEDSMAKEIITMLRHKLAASETIRRKLHNQLQDLRGNVRVFVRCRPFLSCDGSEAIEAKPSLNFHADGASLSFATGTKGSGQTFAFDQVLPTTSSQTDVYNGISDLVQSSLDGYRVCIFSYGQTGSGKTHTMTGYAGDEGIIPRSVRHILRSALDMQESGDWVINLQASIVELYNEEVKDLLNFSGDSGEKLKISFSSGKVNIAGIITDQFVLTSIDAGMEQLNRLMARASKARTTASTGMNEHSSRSHCVFMLDCKCSHKNGTVMEGGLKLVDLAGSERLSRTGTLNDSVRLKESVNINKSLSSLSDVFTALAKKQSHVPYRNSKLTLLLQDCLSGDGKALMFVNVSPTMASSQETLCSLRFANQVSQVELGKAQKNAYIVREVQVSTETSSVRPETAPNPTSAFSSLSSSRVGRRASLVGAPVRQTSQSNPNLASTKMFASTHDSSQINENTNPNPSTQPTSRRVTKREYGTASVGLTGSTYSKKPKQTGWR